MVELEADIERLLLLQAPVAGELRYALALIRIVPELERSGDLAEHIAKRAGTGLAAQLTPAARGHARADGHGEPPSSGGTPPMPSPTATQPPASSLEAADDELDDLHTALTTELLSGVGDRRRGRRRHPGGPVLRAARRPRRAHRRPGRPRRRPSADRRSGLGRTRRDCRQQLGIDGIAPTRSNPALNDEGSSSRPVDSSPPTRPRSGWAGGQPSSSKTPTPPAAYRGPVDRRRTR